MDAPHLNREPPYWLERLVETATPERDRDAIAGDLREIYLSNSQYLAEALRTVPRVVLGRAGVQLDVPSLFLQLSVIFLFAGPWGAFCALPLLLVAGAYRSPQPPAMRRIVFEAAFVSAAAFVILELSSFQVLTAWRVGVDADKTLALYVLLVCPLIPPVLCGLSVLFMTFAASNPRFGVPAGKGNDPRRPQHDPEARIQDALLRRLRTRRQMFWFCCAVSMIALRKQFVDLGLIDYRPLLVAIGYVSAGVLFFLGLAFGRSCRAPEIRQPGFARR